MKLMTTVKNGDLLKTACELVLGHQTNCKGVMSGGIAKQFKKAYPQMFKAYKSYCKNNYPLGRTMLFPIGENRYIANIFGQYGTGKGRQTDYKELESALEDLKFQMEESGLKSLALPYKISCGLAGGDWEIVSEILENCFENSGIDVTLYKL